MTTIRPELPVYRQINIILYVLIKCKLNINLKILWKKALALFNNIILYYYYLNI